MDQNRRRTFHRRSGWRNEPAKRALDWRHEILSAEQTRSAVTEISHDLDVVARGTGERSGCLGAGSNRSEDARDSRTRGRGVARADRWLRCLRVEPSRVGRKAMVRISV